MYKNFNITEEERQQIMEMHKSHGYKQPLNEQVEFGLDPNWDKVKSYLLANKFPPNYTSEVEHVDGEVYVRDSQGKAILFWQDGTVFANKKKGGHMSALGKWTWDGTKPVIPSMDIINPTKKASGFAQNKDDIIKNNKILGVGSRNDIVKQIQMQLYVIYDRDIENKKLPNPGCTVDANYQMSCDGIFGQKTKQLVLKFQEDNGLKKDGYVGNETYRALFMFA